MILIGLITDGISRILVTKGNFKCLFVHGLVMVNWFLNFFGNISEEYVLF